MTYTVAQRSLSHLCSAWDEVSEQAQFGIDYGSRAGHGGNFAVGWGQLGGYYRICSLQGRVKSLYLELE